METMVALPLFQRVLSHTFRGGKGILWRMPQRKAGTTALRIVADAKAGGIGGEITVGGHLCQIENHGPLPTVGELIISPDPRREKG